MRRSSRKTRITRKTRAMRMTRATLITRRTGVRSNTPSAPGIGEKYATKSKQPRVTTAISKTFQPNSLVWKKPKKPSAPQRRSTSTRKTRPNNVCATTKPTGSSFSCRPPLIAAFKLLAAKYWARMPMKAALSMMQHPANHSKNRCAVIRWSHVSSFKASSRRDFRRKVSDFRPLRNFRACSKRPSGFVGVTLFRGLIGKTPVKFWNMVEGRRSSEPPLPGSGLLQGLSCNAPVDCLETLRRTCAPCPSAFRGSFVLAHAGQVRLRLAETSIPSLWLWTGDMSDSGMEEGRVSIGAPVADLPVRRCSSLAQSAVQPCCLRAQPLIMAWSSPRCRAMRLSDSARSSAMCLGLSLSLGAGGSMAPPGARPQVASFASRERAGGREKARGLSRRG
mmetsp:Transcript_76303/g.220439  ORF Transcript_76303/g.220439 Transcript_76303/m.220439 type:complete len:392 (-) Transcript_76303:8-1183(-)